MLTSHEPEVLLVTEAIPKKKGSLPFLTLCLFALNLVGYVAFRASISRDLFGGDAVNTVAARLDSYLLNKSKFKDFPAFCLALHAARKSDPETDGRAFVYDLLSEEGKVALESYLKNPADGRSEEKLLLDLNTRVIEKKLDWPADVLRPHLQGDPALSTMDTDYYNLRILSHLFPAEIVPVFQRRGMLSLLREIPKNARSLFTLHEANRYSPLTALYSIYVGIYLFNRPGAIFPAMVLAGFFYGALSVFTFLLCWRILQSVLWALLATFLFQASAATLLASPQLFSLPYLFVPLVMTAAFYAYLEYKEKGKIRWLLFFAFCSIIGPWFREFSGSIPFIIFAAEIFSFSNKRSRHLLILCLPLMLHSIYPSFLPWLVGLNQGHVYGMYSQANMHTQWNQFVMNWYFAGLLFVQFPPTLWILWTLAVGRSLQKKPFLLAVFAVLTFGFAYSFFWSYRNLEHFLFLRHGAWLFLYIAFMALASFRFGPFIPLYFLAVFIPFLRINLAEIHLAFALVPLVLLFTLWVKDLFTSVLIPVIPRLDRGIQTLDPRFSATPPQRRRIRPLAEKMADPSTIFGGRGNDRRLLLGALSILLTVGILDQFLNIPASVQTQKKLVDTNRTMADWLRTHLSRHSIVITNFFNFTDVFYYSGYHFDPYETVENCPMGPAKVVHKEEDLEKLLRRNFGLRDIYLLSGEHAFYSWQRNYHSHKYVNKPPGELEKLAEFSAKTTYFYLDPLKYFVPRYFVSFIGYMDWATDFYFNNAPRIFQRTVDATYTLYRLTTLIASPKGEAISEQQ